MIRPVLPPHLQECLLAAADGLDSAEEADRYSVSLETVKSRRRFLCDALGARSRSQAVAVAFRLGLLDGKPLPMPDIVQAAQVPLGLLVQTRQEMGWTLARAAGRVGRSAGWLSTRESGERRFGWNELLAYERVLGVELAWDVSP